MPIAGNQQVLRALGVRAKLSVSQPDDPDEQEADRLAAAFVARKPLASGCSDCDDDDWTVRRKADGPTPAGAPQTPLTRSSGEPLAPAIRGEYERFFRADLSLVRMHTGPEAQSAARAFNAQAFALGSELYFGAGRFAPKSDDGRELLAHELAHVMQHRARLETETVRPFPDEPGPLPQRGDVMEVISGPVAGDVPLEGGETVIVVSWPLDDVNAVVELPAPYINAYVPFAIPKSMLSRPPAAVSPGVAAAAASYADEVSLALATLDPIAGVGDYAAAFAVLQELAIGDLLATLDELDRRYLLDLIRANIEASVSSRERIETAALAVVYRNRAAASEPDARRFRELIEVLDPIDKSAIADFLGERRYAVLTGREPEREAVFIVRAGQDDFILSFESWLGRSAAEGELRVMVSPVDLSRAYQSKLRYWDYRGAPVEPGDAWVSVGNWSVPAAPYIQKATFTDRAGFNPVLLGVFPESSANVWTFDWNGDGKPDYGLRIEFDLCSMARSWDEFRYGRPEPGRTFCNIFRSYRLTTSDRTNVTKFDYHFVDPDAWKFGYQGNVAPRLREDDLALLKAFTQMAISMIPVVGEIIMLCEAITGRTIFGERMSTAGRVITAIAALLPVAGGMIAKGLAKESAELAAIALRLGKSQDEVIALLRAVEKEGGANARSVERWQAALRTGGELTAAETAELRRLIQQIDLNARIFRSEAAGSMHFEAQAERLDAIIRTGPMPEETRAIAAAIIEVPGYTGPTEMRAISSAATDVLGEGASVAHAVTPETRTLSTARSIRGAAARGEFPFSHINDAEIKLLEDIRRNLPPNATGRIHLLSLRSRAGGTVIEPLPICSSCTHAIFQQIGDFPGVTVVSHSATFPAPTLNIAP